jgi:hypothetical protein
MKMGKTCVIPILLLLVPCYAAHAHRPIFTDKAATDPNTAVIITEPTISQVIYREITEDAEQVWLAFDADEGFSLFIQIGVPVLNRLKDFRPAMLVVGPGLPDENNPFKLPEQTGAKNFPTDDVQEPRFFHEHFTGTDSWILRSDTVGIPKSGRYYVVAYVPSGEKGKLWLSVGKKESFGLAEWAKFGEWKKKIRKFHEVSEEGGLRIPILSDIGDMFKSSSKKTKADKEKINQKQMQLWHKVDIARYKGSFVCLGDLTGDRCVDFLLYRAGPQTTPGFMAAVDHEGRTLWELGDRTIEKHHHDGAWNEPALRGIAFVYDLNADGKGEVVTEFWKGDKPMLYVLEGSTGQILYQRPSPLDIHIRGGKRSRCHPVGRIVYFDGWLRKPSIVLKYGASNHVPCHAVALDDKLEVLWEIQGSRHSMGHVPTVGDIDSDGKSELVLGTLMIEGEGNILWEKEVDRHADCTVISDVHPAEGQEVLISVCSTGPAYCMSAKGEVLWEKTRQEVPHGQGIWAGNFISEEPGNEVIILRSGHVGDFITLRGRDGKQLAAFRHMKNYEGYPDFPCVVNWEDTQEQSMWIPIDRSVVDGYGHVVADLGKYESLVKKLLQWGESKSNIAVQAFAVDLCGDEREELVLYQPYNGEAILIFTQSDSDGKKKRYVHERDAYNIRSYF